MLSLFCAVYERYLLFTFTQAKQYSSRTVYNTNMYREWCPESPVSQQLLGRYVCKVLVTTYVLLFYFRENFKLVDKNKKKQYFEILIIS